LHDYLHKTSYALDKKITQLNIYSNKTINSLLASSKRPMGLSLVLGHRVVVEDGTGGVERASAGARRRRRCPNSGDEEMVVSDAPSDEKAPGHGWT
jgi:hypothetical protein